MPAWLIFAILFAAINSHLAEQKNKNRTCWALAGFAFGIFSTIILLFMRKKERATEEENIISKEIEESS